MLLLDVLGALGLFLLGMWLMTEGLKLAGGRALEHLLNHWTSSKFRSLASGVLITTLVQSSSAVTIALIGFVNAGLMSFSQSVWVVFGSSLGTTFTGWLVTLFGFSVKINAVIFPLVGIGALLRVFSPLERGRSLGMALAGFGILFMGIDALRTNFSVYADGMNMQSLLDSQTHRVLAGLAIGLVLTSLTQSSSAAIAIILTATASQLSGLDMAAAAVIGANIGTASTGVIASLGATANAKRVALAHVCFNTLAGLLGLLLLPPLLLLTAYFALAESSANLPLLLAMFHTSFNLLGLVIMAPLEPSLTRFLGKRFLPKPVAGQRTAPQEHFIDRNIASIPDLALRALNLELQQLHKLLVDQSLLDVIYKPEDPLGSVAPDTVFSDISAFIADASKTSLTRDQAQQFTAGLAASHYLQNSLQTLQQLRLHASDIQRLDHHLLDNLHRWLEQVNAFCCHCHDNREEQWLQLLRNYQVLKDQLMADAINHSKLDDVDGALNAASLGKRFAEQLLQSEPPLQQLQQNGDHQEGNSSDG